MNERVSEWPNKSMFQCKSVQLQQWLIICAFYFRFGFVAVLCAVCFPYRNSCIFLRPMHFAHERISHICILIWLADGWLVVDLCVCVLERESARARSILHEYAVCELKESRKKCIMLVLFVSTTHLCSSANKTCFYFTFVWVDVIEWVCEFYRIRFLFCCNFFMHTDEMIPTEGSGVISEFYVFHGSRKKIASKCLTCKW